MKVFRVYSREDRARTVGCFIAPAELFDAAFLHLDEHLEESDEGLEVLEVANLDTPMALERWIKEH